MSNSLTMKIELPAPDPEQAYLIGMMFVREIQRVLSGPRSGLWYPAPGNMHYEATTPDSGKAENYYVKFTGTPDRNEIVGRAYQASAPGEAPASRTGRLRQSFFATIEPSKDGNSHNAIIRTSVLYADDLEYGTKRVAPRPYLRPVIEAMQPVIFNMFATKAFTSIVRP